MPPPAMASVVPGQAALNHAVHVEPPRPNHQQAQPAQQPVQQPAQQPAQQPTQQAAAVRDHALAWPPSEGRPSAQGKRGRGRRGRGSRALDVLEPPVRHASTEPAPATERATAASPVRRTSPRGRRASEAPLPRALPAAAAVATELEWTKGWREEMKKRLSESSDQDIAQVLQMELRGKVWQMARHKEATRVIQEAIETTKAEQFAHFRAPLLAELRGKCKEAAGDSVANHVIEAVITKAPPLDSAFIARELLPHARDTVRTPKGCRLVIRLIEFARASLPTGALIDEIARACVDLCYNQYGRKVIQKILEHSEAHRHGIAEAILPQVCDMAKDKQGSYVVEAALRTCSSDDQDKLALALAADVLDVWACKFGKYPVERLLNMSATTTQQQVSRAVREKIFAVQAADLQAFGPTGIVNAHLPELGAMAQAQH